MQKECLQSDFGCLSAFVYFRVLEMDETLESLLFCLTPSLTIYGSKQTSRKYCLVLGMYRANKDLVELYYDFTLIHEHNVPQKPDNDTVPTQS